MERGPHHKTGPGLLAVAAVLVVLSLALSLGRTGLPNPAVQTSAAAAVEPTEGMAIRPQSA